MWNTPNSVTYFQSPSSESITDVYSTKGNFVYKEYYYTCTIQSFKHMIKTLHTAGIGSRSVLLCSNDCTV